MGVVYILHGSKFVITELITKPMNIFLHFSWLKFLICIVLEVNFSSRVWRSNWYYSDIYRDSIVPPRRTGGGSWHLVRYELLLLNLSSSEECRSHLKKVRILSPWQIERNIISMNHGYVIFPLKPIGELAAMLVPHPWCSNSSFLYAYL